MKDTTAFQRWFEGLLEERDWGVREAGRRLGLMASTVSLYKAGDQLARLVWESQDARRVARDAPPGKSAAAAAFQSSRRWRYRFRPLGIAFTMYRTRAVREDALARLHALATERRRSVEAMLDEALQLALPLMERRRPRRPSG